MKGNRSPSLRIERLTEKEKDKIIRLWKNTDMTKRALAKRFSTSESNVAYIVKGVGKEDDN